MPFMPWDGQARLDSPSTSHGHSVSRRFLATKLILICLKRTQKENVYALHERTSPGNLAFCVVSYKRGSMFVVLCLCDPSQITCYHSPFARRCSLSFSLLVQPLYKTFVILVPSFSSRVTLDHHSRPHFLRCAYKLLHGFRDLDGLLAVSVILVVNTFLSRVGCPFQRLIKSSRKGSPREEVYKLITGSVARFGPGYSPTYPRLQTERGRTSWRVRGWRIVSSLFVLCS